MPGLLAAIIPLLSAFVAAGVAWYTVVRRFSGKISSSEASQLWTSSESMRAEYKARAEALEKENAHCREQVQHLLEQLMTQRERIATLEFRIQQMMGDDEPPWKA